jgi:hypothetical protein
MGELSLAGGNITVKPFRAVVQCSLDAAAGQYLVVNDADAVFATTAQHATQFRKGLVVIDVDDSQVNGVASSATTDRARLYLLDGALAATSGAAALPALPDSSLALGEYLIPPTGQAITITPYNPRTTNRNAVLPVLVDGSTVSGHDGAAPAHDGHTRWHPTNGLQTGRSGAWRPPTSFRGFYRATELGAFAAAELSAEPKQMMGRTYCPFGGLSYSVVSLNYTLAGFSEIPQLFVGIGNSNSFALYGGYDQATATTCIAVIRSGVNIAGATEISWLAIGR